MKRYILIDGHSIIYRSYYAFIRNPLRNSKGFNTSAVFGFMKMLKKIEERFNPEYLAVMFDTEKKTFRHDQYEEYKANRKPPPDDLPPQIPVVKDMIDALGIKGFELDGYEADDLLGTIAEKLADRGEVYIVTSDKDLLQLVRDNIYVFDPYGDIIYDEEGVREKFGVDPDKIVDLLSIAGDTSDNVPGVPGFGLKRAKATLKKYQDIEHAIAEDSKLNKFKEDIKFFKSILALDRDVPLSIFPKEIKRDKQKDEELVKIFREMEFYQLMREFFGEEVEGDYKPGKKSLKKGKYGIFVDEEIYASEKKAVTRSFPVNSKNVDVLRESKLLCLSAKDIIKTLGTTPDTYFDIGIGVKLINPDRRFKPADAVVEYLGLVADSFSPYQSADYALRLGPIIEERIEQLDLKEICDVEHKLVPIIVDIEKRGIQVDPKRVIALKRQAEKELSSLEFEIYQLAGRPFNINSSRQLSNILFKVLKLKPGKKKKTGYSTDSSVLKELIEDHPLPGKILIFREKSKLLSTYLKPILKIVEKKDARIHTTFNQLGAATGRLSSTKPNLQNIPPAIKEVFVAQPGYKLISADYSQIELRILAHLSGDRNLVDSFNKNIDIHNRTVQEIFDIDQDQIQHSHRRVAKMVNYGIIYGLSEYGLADSLKVSREDARAIIERHRSFFSEAQQWISDHINRTAEKGETRTIMGRRRVFTAPFTEAKVRAAINSPIQGSAADLIKLAMIRIEQRFNNNNIEQGIIVQVHDELLLEIKEKQVDTAIDIVKEEMENVYKLEVPILVNIGVGDDWQQAH